MKYGKKLMLFFALHSADERKKKQLKSRDTFLCRVIFFSLFLDSVCDVPLFFLVDFKDTVEIVSVKSLQFYTKSHTYWIYMRDLLIELIDS